MTDLLAADNNKIVFDYSAVAADAAETLRSTAVRVRNRLKASIVDGRAPHLEHVLRGKEIATARV
jgi:hypothetical protein